MEPPCGDQAGCAKDKGFTYSQQERSPQLGLTRALWLQQPEGAD